MKIRLGTIRGSSLIKAVGCSGTPSWPKMEPSSTGTGRRLATGYVVGKQDEK